MNKIMAVVNVIIGLFCIGLFMVPNIFASNGYDLAINGIVVARSISLIYGLYCFEKAIKYAINSSEKENS